MLCVDRAGIASQTKLLSRSDCTFGHIGRDDLIVGLVRRRDCRQIVQWTRFGDVELIPFTSLTMPTPPNFRSDFLTAEMSKFRSLDAKPGDDRFRLEHGSSTLALNHSIYTSLEFGISYLPGFSAAFVSPPAEYMRTSTFFALAESPVTRVWLVSRW